MGKVVLANGCFRILHSGHILHLEAAKKMGDLLVVSITNDENVEKEKGFSPFDERQRAAMVKTLSFVDDVVIVPDLLTALQKVQPDILVKGKDYVRKMELDHLIYCSAMGIKIRFTDTPKFSATEMIHAALSR